jgi:Mce-associated membrane protein
MAEAKKPPQDSATSKADTLALIAEAEAEAAEAEALAAAARARARAARLRREVQTQGETEAEAKTEAEAETAETTEEAPDTVEDAADTPEAKTDDTDTDVTDADEAETDADSDATDADEAETEEEVSDQTPKDAESESKSARSWRRVLPPLSVTWKAAVIILICAFVGASGYMVWQRHDTTERNQRTANFIAGARQGVVNMLSLDFKRAKEDVQRVIDSSTGQFRDDFQQRAKDFTTVVEQSKVVTEGTVNAAGVQSIDGNSALVVVAATSRITNAAGAKDEPRRWRLKVSVTDDGGQYKMSKLEFVP